MPLAIAGLVFNAAVWGLSWWPFRTMQQAGLHPLFATSLIFVMGTVLLSIARPGAWPIMLRHRALWWIMVVAGINNAFFNWAVTTGEVVRVVLLFYLMPVWSALAARWLLDEAIDRRAVIRISLALAGAFIVLWEPGVGWPLPRSLADWLAIVAGATFALNNVLLRRYAHVPGEARALSMFVGGAIMASVLSVSLAALWPQAQVNWPDLQSPEWRVWLPIAIAFGLIMLLSNMTLQYGASRLAASITATVMLSEILFASVSAVVWGDEVLSSRALFGGALIVAATLLSIRTESGNVELPKA